MAKRKPARPAAAGAKKTARKAVRTVSKAAAGLRATARKAVRGARSGATRRMATAKASAKKLVKKAARKAAGVARKAEGAARKMAAMPKPKAAARKVQARARKVAVKARKAVREMRKVAARAGAKPAPPKPAVKPVTKPKARSAAKPMASQAAKPAASTPGAAARPAAKPAAARVKTAARKANLDRPRRTVADIHGVPSSLDMGATASAARTGRAEFEEKLHEHTSSSPALTAGDVDADWAAAEAVGDEAPGGDNPTPDQDVVEEIGRALGVEYEDDEELQGGDEIAARDRHRWELDPGSSDDFEER